jgi:nucleotidyltransferase/DNA polymerase involved in DNA repair
VLTLPTALLSVSEALQFFVAVGLLERPELIGKPVAVCHSQGTNGAASSTSEIASASYEARKFGVKGGMRSVPRFMVTIIELRRD